MFACLFAVSFQFAPFNAAVKWLNISTTCRLRTRLARRGREGGAHAGEDIGQVGKGIGHVGQVVGRVGGGKGKRSREERYR